MGRRAESGFTLLELVMVIVIIGILGAVAVRSADLALDRNRYYGTLEEMKQLGHAIAGNPDLVSTGTRTDFGYVGDMGSLPANLDALVTSQGGTWNGPYVVNSVQEDADGFKTDSWAQNYTFPVSGSHVKISSGGGGQSITYQFAPSDASLTSNTVSGTVTDWNGANPIAGDLSNITVTVHHPSGGSMTTSSVTPSAGGVFSISGIPIGIHRIVATHSVLADSAVKLVTVTPGGSSSVGLRFNATLPGTSGGGGGGGSSSDLAYVAGTASTFGSGSRSVQFDIENTTGSTISVSSLAAVYTHNPTVYYEQVTWSASTVWSYSGDRNGSGDTATFSSSQDVAAGATVTVQILNFKNHQSGGGGAYKNMGSTDFEITFSDGSSITLSTP